MDEKIIRIDPARDAEPDRPQLGPVAVSGESPESARGFNITEQYSEVSPAPILHLHRHTDGYITFATERDGDDFRPLTSIRAGELETWFPLFRDQLLKDSFVGINADWRLKSYGAHGKSYGYPLHRGNVLRYINACYVDIDFYKVGLDLGTVIGRVINLQDSGQLPHASMIVKSGHGLWLLWLVHDPNAPEQSPGAFPDQLDLYSRIQQAIIERLLALGADPAARDATRHIRVPGSLHSGSEEVVEWWMQGANKSGYVYTLQELAEQLKATPTRRHGREIIAHSPAKRRGWVAMNARRLREFNTLRAMRRGFSEGCRNNAAKIYGWLLRCNAVGKSDVYGLTSAMGEECHPPLQKAEIKAAVTYEAIRRMRDQTISDWLNITAAEAEMLEKFPPASRFKSADEPPPGPTSMDLQRQKILERRAAIQRIIAELGRVPPVREMATLVEMSGFQGNHATIFKDYRNLGIESRRARGAKEAAKQDSLLLYAKAVDKETGTWSEPVPRTG